MTLRTPRMTLVAALAALALVGFLAPSCSYGGDGTTSTSAPPSPAAQASTTPAAAPKVSPEQRQVADALSASFEAAAAKLEPSVVPIFAEQVVQVRNPFATPGSLFEQFFGPGFQQRFGGGTQRQTVHSLGSGVIVTTDGTILTNNHVVAGADKLTVVLADGTKYPAKVVGTDPDTDVAVVHIDAHDLPAANLGDSDQIKVGQWVIAVGNPFQLLHTVTAGIVSAKGRASLGLADYEDFIQTDASINPGNSGGPLADLDGNVIGLNTAISSPSGGSVGIGLAIPINMARKVMDTLIAHGKVIRGYLGLLPQDIDEGLAKALGLNTTEGALVGDVTSGGPAAKAGFERGDVIVSFNGQKVANSTQLRGLVADAKPGSTAEVVVLRKGEKVTLKPVLAERPADLGHRGQEGPGSQEEAPATHIGLTVQALTPEIAQQLGYGSDQGVVVTAVEPGSPAEDAGFQRGDLIKGVNRTPVRSMDGFRNLIRNLPAGQPAAFLVRRGDNTFFLSVAVPSS